MTDMNIAVLETLLQNPDVYEIDVNAPDSIFYWEKAIGRQEHDRHFANEDEVRALAEQLAAAENITLDHKNPIVEVRLSDATHILLIVPPISSKGTVIRIMKAFGTSMTLDDVIKYSMSQASGDFLKAAVKVSANIVVVGGHMSGKTTMLDVMYQQISPKARIVCIQPMSSFKVTHHDSVVLETRNPDLNGEGGVSAVQLMNHVDMLRPDRLIMVDTAAEEALPQLFDMMSIGQSAMFNMSANSVRDALNRIETSITSANLAMPLLAVREQIARSLNLIVHISLLEKGLRRVVSIDEVVGVRGDSIETQSIFKLDAENNLVPTGYVPQLFERIQTWQSDDMVLDEGIFNFTTSADKRKS